MDQLIDFEGMALFVKVVEHGSLSAAGRAVGIPKATVSRQLALLEQRLGAPLLHRSTRALSLTDVGRRYFTRIRPIVRDAELAQVEVMAGHAAPSGLLRVSATVAYGQLVIAPRLFRFLERHSAVNIDLRLSDERVNLVAGGYDLAIRMGVLDDSELISRKLDTVPMVLVAAPAYVDVHGMPRRAEDLSRHRAIVTRIDIDHWNIGEETVRIVWRMSTGNMFVTRDAVRAGLGIALVPLFLVSHELDQGALLRLLPDQPLPETQVNAVYARSVTPSLALKALLDSLQPEP
ncbi:LysR family transcriptional regulator [Cystobacter fuscus]|uniref:LysR family transcriptional regulator n=1 Tax=Cystobacter fuscus TaxID=43 RepID=UPI002B324EB8|nr:LysR family transcriptional regulator [Cystobacter fuscus]